MSKLFLGGLISAFCAIAGLVASPAAAAEITLNLGHQSSEKNPHHIGSVHFAERVAELTNGSVEIKIFPNAQLGKALEVLEGMLLGTVDITNASAAVTANFVPELNVLNMPFVFRGPDHYENVWEGPILDKLNEYAVPKGFRFLGMNTSGPRHIMSKRPVFAMSDMKGLKIRAIENPVHVAAFNAFGANATAISYPEVYGALQTGVVDGADAANTNYFLKKFYEQSPYWAMVGWLSFSNPITISEKKFQSLTPSQQNALLQAGAEAGAAQRALWLQSDAEYLAQLQAEGVKVTLPDPVPFREASKKVYDEFLKTEADREILKMIQDTK